MSSSRRRFKILQEIAEGGFGKVYLAEQISSDGTFSRIVAIKLLHAKWSTHDEVVKRTRDEARVLGRIRHQHIVKVEDLTSIEGKCAIVMEYLEGVDLKWMSHFLKERHLQFPRAALFEIILAVASALDAAYNGIPLQGDQPLRAIHRDIKPSNIFVTVAGGVKVLDFGTARANFAEREAKTMALAFGSQGYMAPERMLGEEDTPAADIFSLGITLYELLTLEGFGRIPPRPNKFDKKMDERVAAVPLEGDPEWCQQFRDTLRLMLSYKPADRPTAAQLVEIMDLLVQEATDTGLRRYCRTLVQEAKNALPTPESGDPLNGTIVDEDDSGASVEPSTTMEVDRLPSIPPRDNRGPTSAPLPDLSQSPEPSPQRSRSEGPATVLHPGPGSANSRSFGASGTSVAPPPAPKDVKTVVPGLIPGEQPVAQQSQRAGYTDDPAVHPQSAPGSVSQPIEPRSNRMAAIIGVVGVGGLAVGGLALVGLVLGGVLLYIGLRDPGRGPEPQIPVPLVGSKIVSPDERTDVKRVPTTLQYGSSDGAEIEITGPGNFRAEWDGRQPFVLGEAGAGEYTASVKPQGSPKLRLKRFTVDGDKAQCTFTFEPARGEWTGGCT